MTGRPMRGPSGAAPFPPAWLVSANLPIEAVPAGNVLHRVHRNERGPIFFGPGPGSAPTFRFDSASGRFGVFYIASELEGAIAETILRNPERLYVDKKDIVDRSRSEIQFNRDLRLVKMYGDGLQAVGTTNAVSTGPYDPCAAWSDALWDHKDRPDGMVFQSRHASTRMCMAVFERPDLRITVGATVTLESEYLRIVTMLRLLGKTVR